MIPTLASFSFLVGLCPLFKDGGVHADPCLFFSYGVATLPLVFLNSDPDLDLSVLATGLIFP